MTLSIAAFPLIQGLCLIQRKLLHKYFMVPWSVVGAAAKAINSHHKKRSMHDFDNKKVDILLRSKLEAGGIRSSIILENFLTTSDLKG